MRLAFREPCYSHFLVAGGIRLHPRFGRGNIRLATMDAAQADVAIRARGSGGQRLAISLPLVASAKLASNTATTTVLIALVCVTGVP